MDEKKRLVIAIDFDGTIAELAYPALGAIKPEADYYINKLHEEGHYIVIHTCRTGDHQDLVEQYLKDSGINFHHINNNCEHLIEMYATDSRKVSADVYIDDKCLMGIPDSWEEIYNIIQTRFLS